MPATSMLSFSSTGMPVQRTAHLAGLALGVERVGLLQRRPG